MKTQKVGRQLQPETNMLRILFSLATILGCALPFAEQARAAMHVVY